MSIREYKKTYFFMHIFSFVFLIEKKLFHLQNIVFYYQNSNLIYLILAVI